MTDKEFLIEMLTRAEIVFTDHEKENYVTVEAAHTNQNQGYSGFYTSFDFDAAGKLISMGAWE